MIVNQRCSRCSCSADVSKYGINKIEIKTAMKHLPDGCKWFKPEAKEAKNE